MDSSRSYGRSPRTREGKQDSSAEECLGRVSAGSGRTAAAGNFRIKPPVRLAPSAIPRAVIVTQTPFSPGDDSHRRRAATCAAVRLPQLLQGRDAAVLPPSDALPPPPAARQAPALRAAAGAAPRGATRGRGAGADAAPGRAAGPAPPRSPRPRRPKAPPSSFRGPTPGYRPLGGLRPRRRDAPSRGSAPPPRRAYRACLRRAASRSRASSSRKVSSAGSYTSRKGPRGPTCSYRGVGSGGGAAIASRGAHARAGTHAPPRPAAPRRGRGRGWGQELPRGALTPREESVCRRGGGGAPRHSRHWCRQWERAGLAPPRARV